MRVVLRAMSGNRCAWCEAALGDAMEVEHYLPVSAFPWLRYCWENLLPACGGCNGAKRTWHPAELRGRAFIDPVLASVREGEPYEPHEALARVEDRLVEPATDDPGLHLEFLPSDCTWKGLSPIGERTIGKLFSDRSRNDHMQRLSELARGFAMERTADAVVRLYLDLHGHETAFGALLAYWRSFYPSATL